MATAASHVWRPSVSRILYVDGFLPGPRGFPPRPPAVLQWPPKDPADILDYQLDVAALLVGSDGDTISTLDVFVSPNDVGDLQVLSVAADGTRAILWLQGGRIGTLYTLTLSIGTEAGRTVSRSVLLPVSALAIPTIAGLPIILEDGTSLLDGNGDPLLFNSSDT